MEEDRKPSNVIALRNGVALFIGEIYCPILGVDPASHVYLNTAVADFDNSACAVSVVCDSYRRLRDLSNILPDYADKLSRFKQYDLSDEASLFVAELSLIPSDIELVVERLNCVVSAVTGDCVAIHVADENAVWVTKDGEGFSERFFAKNKINAQDFTISYGTGMLNLPIEPLNPLPAITVADITVLDFFKRLKDSGDFVAYHEGEGVLRTSTQGDLEGRTLYHID